MSSQILSLTDRFFIIDLELNSIENIVEKKLLYFFENKKNISHVFQEFYQPVEQALIEFLLEEHHGNKSQVAKILDINRNTLKKKMALYKIQTQKPKEKEHLKFLLEKRVHFLELENIDLLEMSRLKLCFLQKNKDFCFEDIKDQFCLPVEKILIKNSLELFKNNQVKASSFLNINRNTLKKKMTIYHLERQR